MRSGEIAIQSVAMGAARALALAALLAAAAAPAFGQVRLEQTTPSEDATFRVAPAPLLYEVTRPKEFEAYPRNPGAYYDPAFIDPFTRRFETKRSTGRVGLSGCTAPNPPLGPAVAGARDINGWLAAGLSVVWNGPPPVPKSRTSLTPGDRAARPLHVGEMVRRKMGPSDLTGRVVSFVQRNGVSFAMVQWSGAGSPAPTYEDLQRLEPVD